MMKLFPRHQDWRRDREVLSQWYRQPDQMIDTCVWQKYTQPSIVWHAFKGVFEVRCGDEGAVPGGIHRLGSGILKPKEEVARWLLAHNITSITTHSGCAAAARYASEQALAGDVDDIAKRWGEEVALLAHDIDCRHILRHELNRPLKRHDARVAYCIYTPWFAWNKIPDMPKGFSISMRWIDDKNERQESARICFNIAGGGYGFGNWISDDPDTQFIFVVVGEPDGKFSTLRMMSELDEVVSQIGPRAIVRGLTDPRQKMGLPTT